MRKLRHLAVLSAAGAAFIASTVPAAAGPAPDAAPYTIEADP